MERLLRAVLFCVIEDVTLNRPRQQMWQARLKRWVLLVPFLSDISDDFSGNKSIFKNGF